MRDLESKIFNNAEMDKTINLDIEAYEKPMISNIYSYCQNTYFNSAIFMCGAAHRKSIIEKIKNYKTDKKVNLTWTFYEN